MLNWRLDWEDQSWKGKKSVSDWKQPTYFSYLLRIWRDHQQAPWRASLESTATGVVRRFGEVEGMWAFIQAQLELPGESPASVATPEEATRAGRITGRNNER